MVVVAEYGSGWGGVVVWGEGVIRDERYVRCTRYLECWVVYNEW